MAVDREQIYFDQIGDGNNLLVLIHAFPVNRLLFKDMLDEISLPEWTILLPDLPGFGNSQTDKSQDVWTMEELARLIFEMIPEEEYDKLVVGGVSMGGYVTMAFEKEFPGKADAFILANTRDFADDDGGKARQEIVKRILDGQRDNYLKNDLLPRVLGKTSLEQRKEVVNKCWEMFDTVSDSAIMQTQRGMGMREDSRKVFSQITRPILLICGEEDKITGPEVMKPMANNYPNARYLGIENAGHYAVLEKPKEVAGNIKEFLEQL